jgi:hypothetical protein
MATKILGKFEDLKGKVSRDFVVGTFFGVIRYRVDHKLLPFTERILLHFKSRFRVGNFLIFASRRSELTL